MALVSSAVTVTVKVLSPTLRSRSAVFGVLASSSLVIATVALLSFLVAVSVIPLNRLATEAV